MALYSINGNDGEDEYLYDWSGISTVKKAFEHD